MGRCIFDQVPNRPGEVGQIAGDPGWCHDAHRHLDRVGSFGFGKTNLLKVDWPVRSLGAFFVHAGKNE